MMPGWTRNESEDYSELFHGHTTTWDDRPDYTLQPIYGVSVSDLIKRRLESVRKELPDHVLHRITIAPVQPGPGTPEPAEWDGIIRSWCLEVRQMRDGPIYTTMVLSHEYSDHNAWRALDQAKKMAQELGVQHEQQALPRCLAVFVDSDLTDLRGVKLGVALAHAIVTETGLNFDTHNTTKRIWRIPEHTDSRQPETLLTPPKGDWKLINEMAQQVELQLATNIHLERWAGIVEDERQLPMKPSPERKRWKWKIVFIVIGLLGVPILFDLSVSSCNTGSIIALTVKAIPISVGLGVLGITLNQVWDIVSANARGEIHHFVKNIRMFIATFAWKKFLTYCTITFPLLAIFVGLTYIINLGWCSIFLAPHM